MTQQNNLFFSRAGPSDCDCGKFGDNTKPVLVKVPGQGTVADNKLRLQKNLELTVIPKDNVSGAEHEETACTVTTIPLTHNTQHTHIHTHIHTHNTHTHTQHTHIHTHIHTHNTHTYTHTHTHARTHARTHLVCEKRPDQHSDQISLARQSTVERIWIMRGNAIALIACQLSLTFYTF